MIFLPDSETLDEMRLFAATLPVLEALTQGVYTLSEGGRHHAVLLLLLVILLGGHRGELLGGGRRRNDDSVGTFSCQQILVDQQHALQELWAQLHHNKCAIYTLDCVVTDVYLKNTHLYTCIIFVHANFSMYTLPD